VENRKILDNSNRKDNLLRDLWDQPPHPHFWVVFLFVGSFSFILGLKVGHLWIFFAKDFPIFHSVVKSDFYEYKIKTKHLTGPLKISLRVSGEAIITLSLSNTNLPHPLHLNLCCLLKHEQKKLPVYNGCMLVISFYLNDNCLSTSFVKKTFFLNDGEMLLKKKNQLFFKSSLRMEPQNSKSQY